MDIRAYLSVLRRRKWLIVLTTVVAVVVAIIGTAITPPTYSASTTLRLVTAVSGSIDDPRYDLTYADRLMNTYTKITTSGPVLSELTRRLGISQAPTIDVEVPANTELMKITVEDRNPVLAKEAAAALADILTANVKQLYAGGGKSAQDILSEQLSEIKAELDRARKDYEDLLLRVPKDSDQAVEAKQSITLKEATYGTLLDQYERVRAADALRANTATIVEPATLPTSPSKPRKDLNMALGLLLGLAGGIGLAFVFENLDTRLYTTARIEEISQLPVLTQIPAMVPTRQVAIFNGNTPQEDSFRRLRTNLVMGSQDSRPRTLLITSADPGEGKSTVVANLARALGLSGLRVIVIDADLHRPTLHQIFGVDNEVGLSSILTKTEKAGAAVHTTDIPGVQVIPSGPLPPSPAELLDSAMMTALIAKLAEIYDMVLIDTPAILAVNDAAILSADVNGVLLVAGRGQVRQESLLAALQQLTTVEARLVGVVVNREERARSNHYYSRPTAGRVR